jgi:hypothetical protein
MGSMTVVTEDGKGNVVETRTVHVPDESIREDTLHQRAHGALVDLRSIANGSGNMTAAQLTLAVRAIAKALITVLRLHLRRFDDTE